jgi:hypothetical protein
VNDSGGSPSAQKLNLPLLLAGATRSGGGLGAAVIEATGFLRLNNHDRMINPAGMREIIATAGAARAPLPTLPHKLVRRQGSDAGNQNQ